MSEKEFISKIKELRQIKPSQDWVVSTKGRILGIEKKKSLASILEFMPRLVFRYNRLAFATVIVFGFLTGAFTFAQKSLPGDPMFALRKVSEEFKTVFVSKENLPEVQLQIARERLEDVDEIVKENKMNKLALAVQEFQASISRAAEDMVNTKNPDVKQIISETKKIEEHKESIEALGVVVGDNEKLDSALMQLIKRELEDLKQRTLNDSQKEIFTKAIDDFAAGNYSDVLEEIWVINNQK